LTGLRQPHTEPRNIQLHQPRRLGRLSLSAHTAQVGEAVNVLMEAVVSGELTYISRRGGTTPSEGAGNASGAALPTSLSLLHSEAQMADFISAHGGKGVLIDGHNTRRLYFDLVGEPAAAADEVDRRMKPVLDHITELLGKDWVAICSGDPFREAVIDRAHVFAAIRRYGVLLVAVQCDALAPKILTPTSEGRLCAEYAYLEGGAVYVYPTDFDTDEAGLQQVAFGGYNQSGELRGASAVFFSPPIRCRICLGLAVGGGHVARAQAEYFLLGRSNFSQGAEVEDDFRRPFLYMPCRVKHCGPGHSDGSWWGTLHGFMLRPHVQSCLTASTAIRMMAPDELVMKGFYEFSSGSVAESIMSA